MITNSQVRTQLSLHTGTWYAGERIVPDLLRVKSDRGHHWPGGLALGLGSGGPGIVGGAFVYVTRFKSTSSSTCLDSGALGSFARRPDEEK